MSGELQRAEVWLQDTLSADSTLMGLVVGVHTDSVPPNDARNDYPLVLIQYLDGADALLLGARRSHVMAQYIVRGIAIEGYQQNLAAIAARIDVILGRAASQGIGCWRERPYRNSEVENGIKYLHDGGVFRLQVEGT